MVKNKNVEFARRFNLFLGIAVILSSLIWMISNIERADSIVSVWLPFMVAGVFLIFISFLINLAYKKQQ